MKKLRLHNRRTGTWVVVDCGKVYDERTNIQFPPSSQEALGAILYVKQQMGLLWNKMGAIDPIWGDLRLYHKLERDWLRMRMALYGMA